MENSKRFFNVADIQDFTRELNKKGVKFRIEETKLIDEEVGDIDDLYWDVFY